MTWWTPIRFALAGLVIVSVSSSPAAGQVVAYEGFNYPAGTNLNGLTGGTGCSTAWSELGFGSGDPNDNVAETIQTGSLSSVPLIVSGNRVVTGGKFSYDIRNLSTA